MYHILVLDIGKTNKKVVVYNSELELIFKESIQIEETTSVIDSTTIRCDDIRNIQRWMFDKLAYLSNKYDIKVISTTTHGATVAWIDNKGNLVFPVISYTNEIENELRKKFYTVFGTEKILYLDTGTPPYGQLLVVGMQIFYVKEKFPEKFKKTNYILFFPQYISYLLSGKVATEITSLGCHGYLYSYKKRTLSNVAAKLRVLSKLPKKILSPWTIVGNINKKTLDRCPGLGRDCKVVAGIHDSNASLLPYLVFGEKKKNGKFVLSSTGTWCVFMYPGSKFYLSEEDLYKDTLYYIDAFGRPVRSSRVKCGEEHDHYAKLIQDKFKEDPKPMDIDISTLNEILSSAETFVIPTLTPGSGQFPFSKPRIVNENVFFKNIKTAYHTLCLSLAIQSYYAILQAVGKDKNCKFDIYVEGGFRNNKVYHKILSSLFLENNLYITEVQEATSLGAAICAKCGYENIPVLELNNFLQEKIKFNKILIPKVKTVPQTLKKYISKFLYYCSAEK